jgi:Tol biopolymer transport system component/predicted Ser/Thr protein kinase
MPLAEGSRLGPYEVLGLLGAGGMGQVWKARDMRLERTIAIKVLPPKGQASAEARQRFEREARAASALNHPHICTVYDIGSEDGVDYLVMEYLEGETLAQRLRRGSMPLDEALKAAIEIADALDKAHRHGIVHRDLKPGNVMLAPAGVKILDFGLAKMLPKQAGMAVSALETLTTPLTGAGAIVGTLQYMSPEQLEGKEADTRSDLFAFGAVLYEMITGRRTFDGRSKAGVIASILEHDPPSIRTLQPQSPEVLERLLSRCLEKNPERRWQSAGDLLAELEWIRQKGPEATPAATPASRRPLLWMIAAGVCLLAAAVEAGLPLTRPQPEIHGTRFTLGPPPETHFVSPWGATAVSPDGRLLVFGAGGVNGSPQLWVRPLDSLAARPLPGTEDGNVPFWSPDSRSVAFFAHDKLKRLEIAGGTAVSLCDAQIIGPMGGAWNREGTILFSGAGGLYKVSASGGVPARVTEMDANRQELAHGYPQFLPDGKRFLYFIQSGNDDVQGMYAGALDRPQERVLVVRTAQKAFYQAPQSGGQGWLLWLRGQTFMGGQTLVAQPFDGGKARLTGEPAVVAEGISVLPGAHRAAFWASGGGVVVYRGGGVREKFRPVWIGRDGKRLGEAGQADVFSTHVRLSPNEKQAALTRDVFSNWDIWLLDFGRSAVTRVTFNPKWDDWPVWSPDGRQLIFASDRSGSFQLYRKDAGGTAPETQLTSGGNSKFPSDWSRDGKYVLYDEADPKTVTDVWVLPLEGNQAGKPIPVAQGPADERAGVFSPDGKWIAYSSSESGRGEIYVQPFPPTGGKSMVSSQGGTRPKWRGDGKELFYMGPGIDRIMAVNIRTAGAGIEADIPRELFAVTPVPTVTFSYDVTADGQRFLVLQPPIGAGADQNSLTVVLNWQAGLKK